MLYRLRVSTGGRMDAGKRPMGHCVIRPAFQQPIPDTEGGRIVADPGEGIRQTILPIDTEGFQIGGYAVMCRRFLPSLKFGEKVGKRSPRLSIGRVRGYGCSEACFCRGTSAGIPVSIACDQSRFRDVGRDSEA